MDYLGELSYIGKKAQTEIDNLSALLKETTAALEKEYQELGGNPVYTEAGTDVLLRKDTFGGAAGRTDWDYFTSTEDATLTYTLEFDPKFEFGWGGKLPGLAGSKLGSPPSNGKVTTNGFSARLMWLSSKAGFGSENPLPLELVAYLYDQQGGTDGYGRNLRLRFTPKAGHPVVIRQRIKLNTPEKADGILQIDINGIRYAESANMKWRDSADLKINCFGFHVFRGGNDARWAVPTDGFVSVYGPTVVSR